MGGGGGVQEAIDLYNSKEKVSLGELLLQQTTLWISSKTCGRNLCKLGLQRTLIIQWHCFEHSFSLQS